MYSDNQYYIHSIIFIIFTKICGSAENDELQLFAILIAISPWIILLRYPPYRNRIKRKKVSPGRFDHHIIKNVNGIAIAMNQSAKEHFEQLQKSWS